MELQPENAAEALTALLEKQRAACYEDGPPRLEQRKRRLLRLEHRIRNAKEQIIEAIDADFGGRPREETLAAEIFTTLNGIRYARRRLWWWMRTRRPLTSPLFFPGASRIHYQPLGSVGIISPWNYPFHLAMAPLAQAIAAGNCVLLKPSEHAPATAALLDEMLSASFDEEEVAVVRGGPEVAASLSALPLDHLFYTGSAAVGRKVMAAAAENLTPITLELGGKSPAILGEHCILDPAVASIAAGKLLNAGQTCAAPDYVLVPEPWRDTFVEVYKASVEKLYGGPEGSKHYASIINDGHFTRLEDLLEDARSKGATVIELLEGAGLSGRQMAPKLVLDVTDEMEIMREEIFGPLLPVVTCKDEGEAVEYVLARPRPLALYYFSEDAIHVGHVLRQTVSGGVCINDTLLQFVQEGLPFGGVGASGMGRYHGFHGFQTFSHAKGVFHQRSPNGMRFFRPPYGKVFEWAMRLLIR